MTELGDLADRSDVRELVEAFYTVAFADPLIGPIFTDVARMDLDRHLPIVTDFWETVLFRAGVYSRNTLAAHVAVHAMSPFRPEHFVRWLELWCETVDRMFTGPVAEHAKVQGDRIAGAMQRRLVGVSTAPVRRVSQA